MDLNLIWRSLPDLLLGALYSVVITLVSTVLGSLVGGLVAVCRLSRFRVLRVAAQVHVTVMRGSPLLVLLFFAYYALPQAGVTLSAWQAAACVTTLYMTGYAGEIIRAGIQAVDRGQAEAGLSLGLSGWQVLSRVVLPQALPVMLPPLANQTITMLKESSLVSTITLAELTFRAQRIASFTAKPIEMYSTAAAIYLILTVGFNWMFVRLEKLSSRGLTGMGRRA